MSIENDAVAPGRQDRHYTSGLLVSKRSLNVDEFNTSNTFGWFERLSQYTTIGRQKDWLFSQTSLSVGQIIQTPDNIKTSTPDPDDAPYAGLLFFEHGLERYTSTQADNLTVAIGFTGDLSFAEFTQKGLHDLIGVNDPQGWDAQVPTSVGVNLYYTRRESHLLRSNDNWDIDILTRKNVGLGTIKTSASYTAGLSFHDSAINELAIRPGKLSNDTLVSNDPNSSGWFAGFGFIAEVVAWDVLLDGTVLQDSPSVDKEYFVGHAFANAGYKWGRAALHYSLIVSSASFQNQQDIPDNFGSLQFSWMFE